MVSNSQQNGPNDPEKKEKGIAENERANHVSIGADDEQIQDDDVDDASIRETDDPSEVDREGGDLAGTASGDLEEDEV